MLFNGSSHPARNCTVAERKRKLALEAWAYMLHVGVVEFACGCISYFGDVIVG